MVNFFENIEPDAADEIEQLSRLAYELRENRRAILQSHGVDDDDALLRRVADGTADEHPAYEHALAARILDDTRETVRALLDERLKTAKRA